MILDLSYFMQNHVPVKVIKQSKMYYLNKEEREWATEK